MATVTMTITCDPQSRAVNVVGPLWDLMLVHFMLGEARRIAEREANKRDASAIIQPALVVEPGGRHP